ncbi:otospiralin-like [Hypomesus transpacificus]|uniref:otospiralin-like n=1 Tax=Hypomesus transpacificus TaxID=137520 RepID=UPI001F073056|nr:otospiralin-like [Hypomesus transpacificus]XP_046886610.1 otospiralin-like [Hypomesus transpacificus]
MRRLFISILLGVALLGLVHLTGAEEMTGEEAEGASRDRRNVPNWALTSSDFFGWVEELRSHAGYEKIEDLARTFWAHFPSASRLGYGTEEPEE